MFTVYDIEVFPNDWMIVFLDTETGDIERIHNDKEALMSKIQRLSSQILVGYNNYFYDDIILAGLIKGDGPYELTQKIFRKEWISHRLNMVTLDVMQEVRQGLSLKEAQANMGMDIVETPVDFEKEELTPEEVERVFQYCENDVRTTANLFQKREAYFTSKFEIVDTFKLQVSAVKKTRASLSAAVLKAKKPMKKNGWNANPDDRLHLTFDKRLKLMELPAEIVEFYKNIEMAFNHGEKPEVLEKEKLDVEISGVPHTFGFGGLHGARENFKHEGDMLQIDVSSFYPALMINNGFISRRAKSPELFRQLYQDRLRLKGVKDPKQEVYKIVLNATFGASKNAFNDLYDPRQFNQTTMNGQLIMTHLLLLLQPFCELIQSNTDGIIVSYDREMRGMIDEVVKRFGVHYELTLDVDEVAKIAQRDVNNYVVQFADGSIKTKGCFRQHEDGDWERNSFAIADKALTDFYMYGTPVQKTVIDSFKTGRLDLFQIVTKTGKFDGMVWERNGQMEPIQKVNRLFASTDRSSGSVYKVRNTSGTDKLHKVAGAPEKALVWNEAIDALNKRFIDLNWYVKTIQGMIF
ncbi:DNA polymerase B [Domibacillus antri]|uniref:DNA polymerase B n=1 Tax=Domibacillus antri TaxID=1714264 RepID=A0A1Q8Q284_9BACI|nr:DNA polymerase B [Domibacillus antri]OLN21418.1 DNA polymerase B [Domibacillus antri]